MPEDIKDDAYESAFDEAVLQGDGLKDSKDIKEEKTETTDKDAAKPKEGEKTDNDLKDEGGENDKDESGKSDKDEGEENDKDEKDKTYKELEQKYNSLQGMFESETTKSRELEKKLNKLSERNKTEVKSEPKPEEDTELQEYLKEYGYIHKNEAKLRKKEFDTFKQDVIKEISEKYDISIKNAEELLERKAIEEEEKHIYSIKEAHSDYGTDFKYEDIIEWVGGLSPAVKKAYMSIIEDGETDEVIDLIGDYKTAHGIKVSDNVEEINENKDFKKKEKEKKLNEMEVVRGKKSPIGGSAKKNEDFNSAFDEAAASV